MTKVEAEFPNLASLLTNNQDEIIANWAVKVRNIPNGSCQQFTLKDISNWLSKELVIIIETLSTGSKPALAERQKEIALSYLKAGFSIHEVTRELLLSKEVIMPIIWSSFPVGSSQTFEAIAQLDDCLCQMIVNFEYLFTEAMHHKLLDDERQRLKESESLRRTMAALLKKLQLDEVLEIVCSEACRLTNTTGSAVLLTEEEGWLRVTISTGIPLPILDRLPIVDSLAGSSMKQGFPIIANDPTRQLQAYHLNPDLKSLLVIPLSVNETSIGVLDVVNKEGDFTKDDIRIMSLFADQAAIAIENARLHQQAGQVAVVEERQRIARELHDSVTQSLYSASLHVNAAEMALSKGRINVAAENLQELQSMTREAMLDMRLLIFELHPPILEKEGLVIALQTRLESVEARSGIQTKFNVEGERRLPLSVEIELYRIAQEAITNVVKHAKAQQVSVNLKFSDDRLRLKVWDDGVGFDSKNMDQSGGRGLRGIQERAQRINGHLMVESNPGEGTMLDVTVEI
jgi:signal transduction histidine kinase